MSKEKPYNGGTWTTARFHSFIKGALRSASQRWGPKFTVLNEAKTKKKTNKSTGRLAQHYKCASCKEEYVLKDVQVDHIIPIGEFVSWDQTVERMFCEKDNLQVLCKPCHKDKSQKERSCD